MTGQRTLVAGIGNIFLGDDGFGSAVARELAAYDLPDGVEIADIGIRGVHLGYQLLDGYDTLVLVDALQRGESPGTVTTLRTHLAAHLPDDDSSAPVDPHAMGPDAVLALLARLTASAGAAVDTVYVVGCEPASLDDGIGLSPAVEAAIPLAAAAVIGLLNAEESTCTR
ncbi:MAG TPA: hydrogenase maturation protease [Mycobacteriales bacterium]|nr:hydrogenase maturation protease [Mycobacteriales bacterium]